MKLSRIKNIDGVGPFKSLMQRLTNDVSLVADRKEADDLHGAVLGWKNSSAPLGGFRASLIQS